MTKAKAKAVKTQEEDATKSVVSRAQNSAPLIDWMTGKPHDLVFAFNPNYDDKENPELDSWHLLLPVEGELLCVETGNKGYTQKGDLSQLARLMMADVERTLDAVVDYPTITEPRKLKSMHLAVTRI